MTNEISDIWGKTSIPHIQNNSIYQRLTRMLSQKLNWAKEQTLKQREDHQWIAEQKNWLTLSSTLLFALAFQTLKILLIQKLVLAPGQLKFQLWNCNCSGISWLKEKSSLVGLTNSEQELFRKGKLGKGQMRTETGNRWQKSRERSRSFLSTSWEDEDNFLDTIPEPPPSSSQTWNQQDFPNFVATMQRYGISVRAGTTALANSLLQELGLANENNLLSRHKVSSMIEEHGGARAKEHAGQKNILCLNFDGRKDLTLTNDH